MSQPQEQSEGPRPDGAPALDDATRSGHRARPWPSGTECSPASARGRLQAAAARGPGHEGPPAARCALAVHRDACRAWRSAGLPGEEPTRVSRRERAPPDRLRPRRGGAGTALPEITSCAASASFNATSGRSAAGSPARACRGARVGGTHTVPTSSSGRPRPAPTRSRWRWSSRPRRRRACARSVAPGRAAAMLRASCIWRLRRRSHRWLARSAPPALRTASRCSGSRCWRRPPRVRRRPRAARRRRSPVTGGA